MQRNMVDVVGSGDSQHTLATAGPTREIVLHSGAFLFKRHARALLANWPVGTVTELNPAASPSSLHTTGTPS
jgi:hypothetical protein